MVFQLNRAGYQIWTQVFLICKLLQKVMILLAYLPMQKNPGLCMMWRKCLRVFLIPCLGQFTFTNQNSDDSQMSSVAQNVLWHTVFLDSLPFIYLGSHQVISYCISYQRFWQLHHYYTHVLLCNNKVRKLWLQDVFSNRHLKTKLSIKYVISLIKNIHGFMEECLLITKTFFYLPWHVLIITPGVCSKNNGKSYFFKKGE